MLEPNGNQTGSSCLMTEKFPPIPGKTHFMSLNYNVISYDIRLIGLECTRDLTQIAPPC
jgi:hypothetical protein